MAHRNNDINLEADKKRRLALARRAQKSRAISRFYNRNSILGNDWAMFYVIIGSRMTGKSYAITDYICNRKKKMGDKCKAYWMRISETSTKAMLANKADKLVDPDLKRKYNLCLTTKANTVYNYGKPYMEVLPLSQFAKLKGVGYFDKDFDGEYIIALDEYELEQGEKRTSFDVLYNFVGMLENIARTTKNNIRVFLIGNTLQEASTILKAFNFLPEKFGRYYLKSKRCVIDYLEPTQEYFDDRKGSLADILGGGEMSNYTNKIEKDIKQIKQQRIIHPDCVVMFGKTRDKWYTIWDGEIVRKYNNEQINYKIAMRPYLGEAYNREKMTMLLDMYDAQSLYFDSLITQAYFESELAKIRK